MYIQDWVPLRLTGLISLLSKGLSRVFSNTTVLKHLILCHSVFFMVQLSNPYMTAGKTIALIIWTFLGKVMSLLFNMLSRFAIAVLPRSKCLCLYFCQIGSSVLFFKIPHVCINIQQLYFSFIIHCIWHSLGSSTSLQITQFCSFLSPSSIPLSICTTSSLSFICWWHLGCFHILAIVKSAAVNIGIHESFWIMIFSGHMPSIGIAASYGSFQECFASFSLRVL